MTSEVLVVELRFVLFDGVGFNYEAIPFLYQTEEACMHDKDIGAITK